MSALVECIGCEQARHEEHRGVVQAAPEGGVGGATCPCRGECVDHGDRLAESIRRMFANPTTERTGA